MALSLFPRLLLLFSLLAIGAHARPGLHFHPCKTLYVSSFTISSVNLQNPNPNPNSDNPPRFFTIFDFYPSHPRQPHQPLQPFEIFLDRRPQFDSDFNSDFARPRSFPSEASHPLLPYNTSFGERTKDILSVVVALLFGVGCGALTSATMYLAWSLITNQGRYEEFSEDDFSEDDFSPKKGGYCKIPDEVLVKTEAVKDAAVAPAAKEVV